ncbi:CoA ester lyase [Brevundimonas sp.]|uniref:HpcH/HpaI aldolase/citrate lyase family protein n=1 Tax=Brevundimonas sp. TaxID=1871086 RepID=UPI0025CE22A5|nr:CoA ester lyase [Brevundimonas sp.]
MTPRLRSVLFMPANNARAVEKARTLDCDAVVLDLEDAVGPEDKEAARAAAAAALSAGFTGKIAAVRINGLDTPWGEADLRSLAGADAVVLPKVGDASVVAEASGQAAGAPVWAMIETCRGVLNVANIAAAPGVGALVLGQNDLAAEMRCRPGADRAPLWSAMGATVTAARAHGLTALDGVYNAFQDTAGFEAECRQGRAFGFDGKTLIHPSQIAAANAAWTPDPDEVAWARAVVAAYAAPGAEAAGVLRVDGRMVERLHLAEARRILELTGPAA